MTMEWLLWLLGFIWGFSLQCCQQNPLGCIHGFLLGCISFSLLEGPEHVLRFKAAVIRALNPAHDRNMRKSSVKTKQKHTTSWLSCLRFQHNSRHSKRDPTMESHAYQNLVSTPRASILALRTTILRIVQGLEKEIGLKLRDRLYFDVTIAAELFRLSLLSDVAEAEIVTKLIILFAELAALMRRVQEQRRQAEMKASERDERLRESLKKVESHIYEANRQRDEAREELKTAEKKHKEKVDLMHRTSDKQYLKFVEKLEVAETQRGQARKALDQANLERKRELKQQKEKEAKMTEDIEKLRELVERNETLAEICGQTCKEHETPSSKREDSQKPDPGSSAARSPTPSHTPGSALNDPSTPKKPLSNHKVKSGTTPRSSPNGRDSTSDPPNKPCESVVPQGEGAI